MLPVYGAAQLAFEPVHDAVRTRPRLVRGTLYAAGFTAWEYGSGRLLRALRGEASWDYTRARRHLDGLVRADYVPLWGLAGLAYERLHDALR